VRHVNLRVAIVALVALSWVSNCGAAVLSLTDGIAAPSARTYAFDISAPGSFVATLSDLGFPEPLEFASLAVAPLGGSFALGSELSPGSFVFTAPGPGSYVALVAAKPGALTGFGFYSVNIAPLAAVPEPQVWTLMAFGLSLAAWLRLRHRRARDHLA